MSSFHILQEKNAASSINRQSIKKVSQQTIKIKLLFANTSHLMSMLEAKWS